MLRPMTGDSANGPIRNNLFKPLSHDLASPQMIDNHICRTASVFVVIASQMWLLHSTTLQIHEFADERLVQPYAILSNKWGKREVSYDDVRATRHLSSEWKASDGWNKILKCARRAKKDGLEYFWVDTCMLIPM